MSYAAVDAACDQMAKQFLQNSLPPVLTDGILYDIFYISTLYVYVCRKFGGEVVHVGILALQAKGISCFGWEVRQKLRVLEYL